MIIVNPIPRILGVAALMHVRIQKIFVCEAAESSGTCKYPNEAQCSKIYTILIHIPE